MAASVTEPHRDSIPSRVADANPWHRAGDHRRGGDLGAEHWVDRVEAGAEGDRRRLLRELRVFTAAQRRVARDTTDMQAVFETLGNFPLADILRLSTLRLRFVRSPEFRGLFEQRSMPDLRNESIAAMRSLPAGTLGHEFACYMEGWGMDNSFLRHMVVDTPDTYYAFRYAHLHDLLHFVLGYWPNHKRPEMEIEAFLFAQTRGLNHVLFIAGFMRNLRRTDRRLARAMPAHLRAAYRRGRRAHNVMLARWEDLMDRPLDEVRRQLGIDDMAAVPSERPPRRDVTETPRLAHAVLNVADVDAAARFYEDVWGLEVSARDERLGAVFMTDGTDHHTLALTRSWPRGALGPVRGIASDVRTGLGLLRSRRSGQRSGAEGRKVTMPPPALIREHIRPGLGHLGYRVSSLEELRAWYQRLTDAGIRVDWVVNHNDLITGMYFKDPGGIRCEIFVDGPGAAAKEAAKAAGATIDDLREDDFYNWEVDLDAVLGQDT